MHDVENLVNNFIQTARERFLISLVITVFFTLLEMKAYALFGLIVLSLVHTVLMLLINLSFQAYHTGEPKYNELVNLVNKFHFTVFAIHLLIIFYFLL